VSEENVETVRTAYEHLNRGDIQALVELLDDEFVMDMSERVFNPDIYRGRDDIPRFYTEVRSAWESYQWEVEGTRDTSDSVVAMLHCHGQSRKGGPPVDWHVAWLWKFQSRRVVSLRFYRDPTQALKAVGLEE
jgi:ketosteroid isomerase-like protein